MPKNTMVGSHIFTKPLYHAASFDDFQDQVARNDLTKKAKKIPAAKEIRMLANMLPKLHEAWLAARTGDDEEVAYIRTMRLVETFLTVGKNREKMDDNKWMHGIDKIIGKIMTEADTLNESLRLRYKQKEEAAAATVAVATNGHPNNKEHVVKIEREQDDGFTTEDGPDGDVVKTRITAEELNGFLKDASRNSDKLLILDLRDSGVFSSSHIKCENILNLCAERLNSKLTVAVIEEMLSPKDLRLWNRRSDFNHIVVLDNLGNCDELSKDVAAVIRVITEYSSVKLKNPPKVLDEGFYNFSSRYPHMVIVVNGQMKQVTIQSSRPGVHDIKFPSVSLFGDNSFSPVFPSSVMNDLKPSSFGEFEKPMAQHLEEISGSDWGFDQFPAELPSRNRMTAPEQPPHQRTLPIANRRLKPAIPAPKVRDVPIVLEHSEDYNDVISNPNITLKRGSHSHDDMPAESLKSETVFIPPVSRTNKPSELEPVKPDLKPSLASSGSSSSLTAGSADGEISSWNSLESFAKRRSREISAAGPGFDSRPLDNLENKAPVLVARRDLKHPDDSFPATSRPNSAVLPRSPKEMRPVPIVNRTVKPLAIQINFEELTPSAQLVIPYEKNNVRRGYTGLKNSGNSCYMNAVLQCLAHIPVIRDYYRNGRYRKDVSMKNRNTPGAIPGKISVCMEELMTLLWSGVYSSFTPRFMKNCLADTDMMFRGSEQEDACEALIAIVDRLHEDTNRAKLAGVSREVLSTIRNIENSEELKPARLADETMKRSQMVTDSHISTLISFLKESVITCRSCGHQSCTFRIDPIVHVALGPNDGTELKLANLLRNVMNDEGIEWTCPKCKQDQTVTQKHLFHSVPRVLLVHFKRYGDFDTGRKDKRYIQFDESLNLAEYCEKSVVKRAKYRLSAVLDHYGDVNGGHYTASVLHECLPEINTVCSCNKWIRFDDQNVTKARDICTAYAYVLFYELVCSS